MSFKGTLPAAMLAGILVQAVWLIFGVLAWTQPTFVTGFQSGGTILGTHYRSRLSRLLTIASRFEQKSEYRRKGLDTERQKVYGPGGDFLHESIASYLEAPLENNLDVQYHSLTRHIRSTDAISDMREKYAKFYSNMTTFVNELGSKLKSDAPSELQYVTIIPNILRTDDPDFDPFNKEKVEEKALIVVNVMKLLIIEVKQYIDDSHQGWFSKQATTLNIWIGLVKVTLMNLKLWKDSKSIESISDMREKYATFHSNMTTFVNELGSKLKSDAPSELQYVTIIPNILRPKDPDFDPFDKKKVEEKALIVVNFMELLLSEVKQYIDDSHQGWFSQQTTTLNIWIGLVKIALMNLKLSKDSNLIEYLEAGIGGLNTKFKSSRRILSSTDVEELQSLLSVLKKTYKY